MPSTVRGLVRLFGLRAEDGAPCASDDECLSRLCTDGVCCDTRCGGESPTDCVACSAAAGAAVAGVCSAVVVCPKWRAAVEAMVGERFGIF